MFRIENNKFSFVTIEFQLVLVHPALNVNYTDFDAAGCTVLFYVTVETECSIQLTIIGIEMERHVMVSENITQRRGVQ